MGPPSVQQSQPTVQYSQAPGHIGQPQIQSGQPIFQSTWLSGPSGQPVVVQRQPQPQQVQLAGQLGQPQYQLGQPFGQITQTTGHLSGAAQSGTQMVFISQAQPGFGPQAGLQTPSGFQVQGGIQYPSVYQTLLVPQTLFGFQLPYNYQQPQGPTSFAPYQNYQQLQVSPYQNYQQSYVAAAGHFGNQWNAGGQNQSPYGKNPMGPNPSGQSQWGQPPTGWNPGTPSYSQPQMPFNPQVPFFMTLELPDVSKLTNDPIFHHPYWPPVPSKIPGDCPKFEGRANEDPQTHVMTYHLWCSSNSWLDDSIRLRLFQRTLTGSTAKWYIGLPRGSFQDFYSLAMAFLTHFQLPIRCETGIHLLTSLKQTTATHISDHIHEWRWR